VAWGSSFTTKRTENAIRRLHAKFPTTPLADLEDAWYHFYAPNALAKPSLGVEILRTIEAEHVKYMDVDEVNRLNALDDDKWQRQRFMLTALEKILGGKCSKGVEIERITPDTYQGRMCFSDQQILKSPKLRVTLIDRLSDGERGFSQFVSNFVGEWFLEKELYDRDHEMLYRILG